MLLYKELLIEITVLVRGGQAVIVLTRQKILVLYIVDMLSDVLRQTSCLSSTFLLDEVLVVSIVSLRIYNPLIDICIPEWITYNVFFWFWTLNFVAVLRHGQFGS